MTTDRNRSCKERLPEEYRREVHNLRIMLAAERAGGSDSEQGAAILDKENLGPLHEYGLCFDYVAPGTFKGQRRGFFRYQISYGGPADEWRFFLDERLEPERVEYWFLDWFDGAHKTLRAGADFDLLMEVWDQLTAGRDEETIRGLMKAADE